MGAWGPFAPLPIWGKKRKGQRLQGERKWGGEAPQKLEGGKEGEKWGGEGGTDEGDINPFVPGRGRSALTQQRSERKPSPSLLL